ncbi:hypothetical protein EV363DRAFT_388406 [Boletus edulis]|nr:hypothetical protein EV363DRAFT_388406 [Boletus edulis]
MSSLAIISALVFLSSLPVARADIHCDISIGGTNVCSWFNDFNGGVVIAVVGGIATLVVFLGFNIYASLFRPRVSPRYAHSNQRQVPVTDPLPPVQSYAVPGENWYPVVPNKGWSAIDPSRDYPRVQNAGPAYRGYVV